MRPTFPFLVLLLMLSVSALAQVTAVPPLMNFQGRVTKPDGTPVPDGDHTLTFRLFNVASGGTALWSHTMSVSARHGTFAALLGGTAGTKSGPLTSTLFTGDRWMEIQIGNDPPLTPRQQIVSVAYAMKADSVKDNAITSASIANGTITAADLAAGTLNPLAWLLGGNSGTNASQFLGTTDDKPLELRVNNRRVMRYQHAEEATLGYRSTNMLGGASVNEIGADVVGGTIAGGGLDSFTGTDNPNRVLGYFGTVGGGEGNTTFDFAATVAGGSNNIAGNDQVSVGGGFLNAAYGPSDTIGGGQNNTTNGLGATVPGGMRNTAEGVTSFAGGNRAKALHDGSFVWADSQNADFVSTGVQQFLIRASGGVGINTNNPGDASLHVQGGLTNIAIFGGNLAPIGEAVFESNRTTSTKYHLTLCNNNQEVFYVDGNGRPHGTGGYVSLSDARFKRNVVPIENALDAILNLRGITFEWDTEKWKERGFPSGRQIGFLAQEVEQVLPELVTTDARGYKMVSYTDAVPVLVEAVKTLKKDNDAKAKRLADVEAKNAELEARLERIEAALKAGSR